MSSALVERGTSTMPLEQYKTLPYSIALGATILISTAVFAPPPIYAWSGSTPKVDRRIESVRWYQTGSGGLVVQGSAPEQKQRLLGNSVAELRSMSGLTADQIARLFGVSRRTVQTWVAGGPMASQHEERLSRVLAEIRPLGLNADERRAALLSSASGPSLFHRLISEVGTKAVLQVSATSVRDRLKV